MARFTLCSALLLFVPFLAGVKGEETQSPGSVDFFPVLSLYGTVLEGEVSWRPDWPLSIPPDAFSFPSHGALALTLIRDRGDPAELPAELLTVRWNGDGLLSEFPLFRDDSFFQVQTRFGRGGLIRGFSISSETSAPETAWDILIVEYEEGFPSLVKVTQGETLYFTLIEYETFRATEIWYNQEGNALAVFSYQYEAPGGRILRFMRTDLLSGEESAEAYHYDSMGNISGIAASSGEYAALYVGKGKPRYWERTVFREALPQEPAQSAALADALPEAPDSFGAAGFSRFSFQWNEEGLLVRLTGNFQGEAGHVSDGGAGNGDVMETDVRYEYIRDEQGAWIERRDTPMIRRSGFLVPGPVERFFRRIEYPAP
ncbi:MAG: hypothetical protein LBP81_04660 [Treponema sp.]|jgi:hypothetical protein|nr:hypothetical protein [Treponema sp.]